MNSVVINHYVPSHCLCLLENTASPASEFQMVLFGLEAGSCVLSYRFELHFFDSHDFSSEVCKGLLAVEIIKPHA